MNCLGFLQSFRIHFLRILGAAVLFFLPGHYAFADRVVYFDAAGTSQTFNNDELSNGKYTARCYINMTNVGPSSQDVTITVTHEVQTTPAGSPMNAGIGGGSIEAGSVFSGTPFTLASGDRKAFAWDFPSLASGATVKQDIRCYGKISVKDTAATSPGFINANGLLFTWMQSPPLKSSAGITLRAPTSLNTTNFSIGEGRPF